MDIDQISKYEKLAKKKFGQNFLVDKSALETIIQAGNITKDDVILEIGPGLGVLTRELAQRAKKVVAIELDTRMYSIVRKELADFPNVQIINDDILNIPNTTLRSILHDDENTSDSYKVISNIPYMITSPILKKFTVQEPSPQEMVLLVQKEVGQRICAQPGQLSILGVATQLFMKTHYEKTVPASSFIPAPKVNSAIISFKKDNSYLGILEKDGISQKRFFQILKFGFASKRKQLHNNLSSGLHTSTNISKELLESCNLESNIRAQALSIHDWISLINEIEKRSL